MKSSRHMRTLWFALSCGLVTLAVSAGAFAQICKPVSQRTGELGCWITANAALGGLRHASHPSNRRSCRTLGRC